MDLYVSKENLMKVAFFDVDETLIHCKSMFVFLSFYLQQTNKMLQGYSYEGIMNEIQVKVSHGASRLQINSFYYKLFEGESQDEVKKIARQLFLKTQNDLFKHKIVDRLKNHIANNDQVVLVSGAMQDIIEPIADHLGVNQFLCSTPEVKDGKYTGNLLQQSIGDNKSKLVLQYTSMCGIDAKECYAYGDHISDMPMLEMVGYPCVVDPEENFAKIAKLKQWEII